MTLTSSSCQTPHSNSDTSMYRSTAHSKIGVQSIIQAAIPDKLLDLFSRNEKANRRMNTEHTGLHSDYHSLVPYLRGRQARDASREIDVSGPRSDEDDVETALGRAGTPPSRCAISWSISSRRHIERVADAVCIGLKKPELVTRSRLSFFRSRMWSRMNDCCIVRS